MLDTATKALEVRAWLDMNLAAAPPLTPALTRRIIGLLNPAPADASIALTPTANGTDGKFTPVGDICSK